MVDDDKIIKINHLEKIREDVRDEIKNRIKQRDDYSVQMVISLGVVAGVAFSKSEFINVLLIAPPVAMYFTMLMMYSYKLHDVLTHYLREKIEPQLSALCGIPASDEFETFYILQSRPGMRRSFFIIMMWIVVVSPISYMWYFISYHSETALTPTTLLGIAVSFLIAASLLTRVYKNSIDKYKTKNISKH